MFFTQPENPFVQAENIDWESAGEGIERKILCYDEQVMMVCVRFIKGAVGALHHHIHRQVTFIESGIFEVTINDHKMILNQGDSFFVAPDLVHGVLALESGTLIDVFTPCRKDFL